MATKDKAKAKGTTAKGGGGKPPNILVIWGDDIGQSNLSCYTHGLMGYQTPNIDRIAKEGMLFTDSYGEQSCTAGRSSFITGQSVLRTGLSKVGIPAAPIGMNDKIVTIAGAAQGAGLRDRPVRQEPPGRPQQHAAHQPRLRRVLRQPLSPQCRGRAGDGQLSEGSEVPRALRAARRDPFLGHRQGRHDRQPRWGKVGKQKIEDTGPLTKKRMETCDDEFVAAATDFIKRQEKAGKPWFVWLNTTHMHLFTHTKPESLGQAGKWQSPYHDTMIDHDKNVGQMLDLLDELGIADDTFVQYSTDNGPHRNSWPDGGMTPFRSEKNTNWEGAFRIPLLVRWPGKVAAGSVANGIVQHHDWLPTFLEMAGAPDVVDKLKKGYKAIGRTYKNHIDGFSLLPLHHRQGQGEPAQLLLLHQRRRRHPGDALRQLEARVPGAALPRNDAGLGGAVHAPADAQALQPAHRSVRVRRPDVEHATTTGSSTTPTSSTRRRPARRCSRRRSRTSRRSRSPAASRSTTPSPR